MTDLDSTIAAIDEANSHDPNSFRGEPLALWQGRSASGWLEKLDPEAGDALQLAVRAHHLRRWELARSDYPEGRAGYLRWRRDNKAHQAESLASLMRSDGWPEATVERTGEILGRTKLRSDAETQSLEDAACLVFLETQFDDMLDQTDHDHLVTIVVKTLKKMSPAAVTLAASIGLTPRTQAVLADAVQQLQQLEAEDSDDD